MFVWSDVLRRGRSILHIDRDDLVRRIGARGWPGCPSDGICSRYGQLTVELGTEGRFEIAWNAITSSDFVRSGRAVVDGPRWDVTLDDGYSCAHPDARPPPSQTFRFEGTRLGDTLRLAIGPPRRNPWPLIDARRSDIAIAFRRVTSERERDALRFRACSPTAAACRAECRALDELLGP